jgi:hypothetical protein
MHLSCDDFPNLTSIMPKESTIILEWQKFDIRILMNREGKFIKPSNYMISFHWKCER